MEPLVNGQPGPHECWDELAEHALTGDDVLIGGVVYGPDGYEAEPVQDDEEEQL